MFVLELFNLGWPLVIKNTDMVSSVCLVKVEMSGQPKLFMKCTLSVLIL